MERIISHRAVGWAQDGLAWCRAGGWGRGISVGHGWVGAAAAWKTRGTGLRGRKPGSVKVASQWELLSADADCAVFSTSAWVRLVNEEEFPALTPGVMGAAVGSIGADGDVRSEERRVGKEGR